MKENVLFLFLVLLISVADVDAQPGQAAAKHALEAGFINPPIVSRPKALWPWVNGNFSLSQITYEMEQAKLKGMGGFDIWDVGTMVDPDKIVPDGPPFLSDASLQGIKHAVEEGDRLGLEIGLISSSSWNAGGSWVKPEHGAMGLFRKDTIVNGPIVFNAAIPFPIIADKNGGREMLIVRDAVTGLPIYYKEVGLIAHPFNADSSIKNVTAVIDLQKNRTAISGLINWQVPAGKWRITRYVCAPTGQPLMIPSPLSNGLMLDHFSAAAQEANLAYIFKRLKETLGSLKNRSLKYLYEDSYEVNSAVWTPLLPEEFLKKTGYSLIPFLPVLDGYSVGGKEITERFLFDFTKLLSDLIINNHYEKGRQLCQQEGLGFYAEAGGPGKPIHNVPFEDLKALGSLTVPRGEFWNNHGDLENLQIVKGISSAAHIYNQRYVEAEAFTSVWLWQEGPGALKPLADRAMCEGLNRFVYHTFPHTPPESGRPGWVYNFGTLINTTNGWWPKSEGFHQYLARCSYLLQQGEFIGDVAFYYGDEAPNFVKPKHIHATLGLGYDYDVVNTDVILNKMTVRNGRIYLPHGQYYNVLVLPQDQRMNPLVLKKLEQMVAAGATIIGPKPQHSYSLQNYKMADQQVQSLAAKLWGNVDSSNLKERVYGKGKIIWGKTVREVLLQNGITPDVEYKSNAADTIDFIHRRTSDADIYFIRNKKPDAISGTCTFRVKDKQPEWWDAESGNKVPITIFSRTKNGISIPLDLAPHASAFIIFQKPLQPKIQPEEAIDVNTIIYTPKGIVSTKTAKPATAHQVAITSPWELRFEHKGNTPVVDSMQELRSLHLYNDSAIKYFSGQVAYYNSFEIAATDLKKDAVLLLALNNVKEIADVYLNGKLLGQHWYPAHAFTLKEELKPGKNYLVIEVVNSINNGLIGDAQKPKEYRQMRSNINRLPNAWMKPFAEAPLLEAGLIGPVTLQWATLVH
ncbi:MAG: glycosyl hydrolase [Ginsengibacter sp.]